MNQKEAVHERLKEYACVAPDQMMQKLQINAEGITQEEAIIRRQKYGNNAPSAKNKDNVLLYSKSFCESIFYDPVFPWFNLFGNRCIFVQ